VFLSKRNVLTQDLEWLDDELSQRRVSAPLRELFGISSRSGQIWTSWGALNCMISTRRGDINLSKEIVVTWASARRVLQLRKRAKLVELHIEARRVVGSLYKAKVSKRTAPVWMRRLLISVWIGTRSYMLGRTSTSESSSESTVERPSARIPLLTRLTTGQMRTKRAHEDLLRSDETARTIYQRQAANASRFDPTVRPSVQKIKDVLKVGQRFLVQVIKVPEERRGEGIHSYFASW